MNQSGEKGIADRASAQIVFIAIQSLATTLEAFLHKDIGRRYLGLNAVVGAFLIMAVCVIFEECNTRALCVWWFAYVTIVFWRVFVSKHSTQHSYYAGSPWLRSSSSRISEYVFVRYVEPLLILGLGLIVVRFNQPFGGYLIVGALSLATVNSMTVKIERQRFLNLRDAVLEQRRLAEQFQNSSDLR